jgi:GNAT superfamily N-acetyltransferase
MVLAATMTIEGAAWRALPPAPRAVAPNIGDGAIAIDLLRHLDRERLILYGGRRPERDQWERHCRQQSEFVLVATHGPGATRRVVGSLECRVLTDAAGPWGMIDRLFVEPDYRRRGIASRLLGGIIAFGRERGLVSLRENIPNVLVRDPASGVWEPHIPAGEEWGGLRSLGATVNACVRERQGCAVAGAHRGVGERRCGRIGMGLTMPIARSAFAASANERFAPSSTAMLDRLVRDLAELAGVAPDLAAGSPPASRTEAA